MVPSLFIEYRAVVLFRLRSNLKSIRAISYHFPRYLLVSNDLTAIAPLGMVVHDLKPKIAIKVNADVIRRFFMVITVLVSIMKQLSGR
jgi:hypothetical protein